MSDCQCNTFVIRSQDKGNSSPLGSITKSRAAPAVEYPSAVVRRFALQSAARDLLPSERVGYCLRRRVTRGDPVDVLHSPVNKSAHYGNLIVCGSVWACPVCAAKISERRREELTEAVERWRAQGGSVLLLTLTLQHSQGEACAEVLEGLLQAHSDFWRFRAGRRIRENYDIVGRVRGLEVTHGGNGWHAHLHILLFIGDADQVGAWFVDELRREIAEHWQHVLARRERFASVAHGVDLRFTDQDVADYVTKYGGDYLDQDQAQSQADQWTEAHEVAKSHVKTARWGGRTANALLADYLVGDSEAGQLWVEYAKAFKGKRQLVWSAGLRDLLGLGREKEDEQLATEQRESAYVLARLDIHEWRKVLANDIRAELLQVAREGDQEAVKTFLLDFGIEASYPDVEDQDQGGQVQPDEKVFECLFEDIHEHLAEHRVEIVGELEFRPHPEIPGRMVAWLPVARVLDL